MLGLLFDIEDGVSIYDKSADLSLYSMAYSLCIILLVHAAGFKKIRNGNLNLHRGTCWENITLVETRRVRHALKYTHACRELSPVTVSPVERIHYLDKVLFLPIELHLTKQKFPFIQQISEWRIIRYTLSTAMITRHYKISTEADRMPQTNRNALCWTYSDMPLCTCPSMFTAHFVDSVVRDQRLKSVCYCHVSMYPCPRVLPTHAY